MSEEHKGIGAIKVSDEDLAATAARVAAGLKQRGWQVKRDGAVLEAGIEDLLLLRVVIQPADVCNQLGILIGMAHADLIKIARGRNMRAPGPHAATPEERIISRNSNDLRDAKRSMAQRAGRYSREDKG